VDFINKYRALYQWGFEANPKWFQDEGLTVGTQLRAHASCCGHTLKGFKGYHTKWSPNQDSDYMKKIIQRYEGLPDAFWNYSWTIYNYRKYQLKTEGTPQLEVGDLGVNVEGADAKDIKDYNDYMRLSDYLGLSFRDLPEDVKSYCKREGRTTSCGWFDDGGMS
jgi:hypothetical protein